MILIKLKSRTRSSEVTENMVRIHFGTLSEIRFSLPRNCKYLGAGLLSGMLAVFLPRPSAFD